MRNKKEKTPNNVLKSPLRVAVKQSCSLKEERLSFPMVMEMGLKGIAIEYIF